MPAKKPEELHHKNDYRPRFTDDVHERILLLTAELTRMNEYKPIRPSVLLRTIVEMELENLDSSKMNKILESIRDAA